MVSAWSTNRHAAVVGLTPQTKRYEKDSALERGVARIMSAPAKSYALAVGLVQRRLDALPIDFHSRAPALRGTSIASPMTMPSLEKGRSIIMRSRN